MTAALPQPGARTVLHVTPALDYAVAGRQRQSVQTWPAEVPFPSWAGSRTRLYE